jgi:hypothetical protein
MDLLRSVQTPTQVIADIKSRQTVFVLYSFRDDWTELDAVSFTEIFTLLFLLSLKKQADSIARKRRSDMDLRCTTCGEPWDVDYLRHEAIHETDLDPAEADVWRQLSDGRQKFHDRYRAKLLAAGREFAGSVIKIVRSGRRPVAERENQRHNR